MAAAEADVRCDKHENDNSETLVNEPIEMDQDWSSLT